MAPAPLSQGQTGLLGSLRSPLPSDHGIPTSVAFTSIEPAHIVASFCSGDTVLYDLEAESALLTLESPGSSGKGARGGGLASECSKAPVLCFGDPRLAQLQVAPHPLWGSELEGDEVPTTAFTDSRGLRRAERRERVRDSHISPLSGVGKLSQWLSSSCPCQGRPQYPLYQ